MASTSYVDHYQSITTSILAALDQGVKPWARPWKTAGGADRLDTALPFNAASGRNYRGLNVPLLWSVAQAQGYARHVWLSFKQAQELGGHVKKGEKATHVYFFQFLDRERESDAGEVERVKVPLIRVYPVFNVEQTEGVRVAVRPAVAATETTGAVGVVGSILSRLGLAGCLRHGGDAAFYAPGPDVIQMPAPDAFHCVEAYRATLLHECGHATGHRDRLARDFSGRFGSESYAFEELVAELTSAFSQAALGLRADVDNHASYIEGWQRVLRQDKFAFVKACSLAQAATDYLLETHDEATEAAAQSALALAA